MSCTTGTKTPGFGEANNRESWATTLTELAAWIAFSRPRHRMAADVGLYRSDLKERSARFCFKLVDLKYLFARWTILRI